MTRQSNVPGLWGPLLPGQSYWEEEIIPVRTVFCVSTSRRSVGDTLREWLFAGGGPSGGLCALDITESTCPPLFFLN